MRALIRWGIGLSSLLLVASVSDGYVLVSPVTQCPLGHAPDMRSACPFYYLHPNGQIDGPYYILRPPFPPAQGFLPGPIGKAIMSGYLPAELLKSKEAMTIGDMPLLKNSKGQNRDSGPPNYPAQAQMAGGPPGDGSQNDGPDLGGTYGGPAYHSGVPGPFPMLSGPFAMPPASQAQVPYMGQGSGMGMMPPGGMPYGQQMPYPGGGGMGMPYAPHMPYPGGGGMGMPYASHMPYPGNYGGMGMAPNNAMPMMFPRPMPYPMNAPSMGTMPYGNAPMMQPMPMVNPQPMPLPLPVIRNQPMVYAPYGGMMPYAANQQYLGGGIWLVQNTAPNPAIGRMPMMAPYGGPYPYPPTMQGMVMPNPNGGYMSMPSMPSMRSVQPTPYMSSMPSVSTMPSIPAMPSMSNMSPYPAFQPYGSLDFMSPLQRPQTAQMGPVQMQMPRMDMAEPPKVNAGGIFPTHPFVRSPRDFFMWGDSMDDARMKGNRPYPVP